MVVNIHRKTQYAAELPIHGRMLIPADGAKRSGEPMWNSPQTTDQQIKGILSNKKPDPKSKRNN